MTTLLLLACLGISSVAALQSRIIGGQPTDTTHYPYMVALTNSNGYFCGGAIIGDFWVLTAAHCVENKGTHFNVETNDGNIHSSVTKYTVVKSTPHPMYTGTGNFKNNIAVVKVSSSNALTSGSADRIDLALPGSVFDDNQCFLTGWGRTTDDGDLATVLQQATGTIWPRLECERAWSIYDHAAQMCFHNTHSGACHGDGGSPLNCNNKLAGVTSFGHDGCGLNTESVFTRVSSYYSWISANMQ